ncbi:hypothetical protein V2W45_1244664, partial [Cenococcum geophilum]
FPKTLPQRCLRAKKDSRVIISIAIVSGLKEESLSNSDKGIRKPYLILNNSLIKLTAYLKYLKEDV